MPVTLRLATASDLAGIVRVYVRAYAQQPWNELNDPASSERYLRWVINHPHTFCVVALGAPQATVLGSRPPFPRREGGQGVRSAPVTPSASTESETHGEEVIGFALAGERS